MNLLWVVVVSRINVQAYSERFESSECTYIRIKYMWFLCEYWNIDETSFFLRTYLFWKLALIENFKINDVFLSIPFSSSPLILDNRSSTFFLLPLGFSSLCYRSTMRNGSNCPLLSVSYKSSNVININTNEMSWINVK